MNRGIALACLLTLAGVRPGAAADDGWTLEYAGGGGLRLRHRHGEVARAEYHFWGAGWSWVGQRVEESASDGGDPRFRIHLDQLGVRIDGQVRRTGPRELTYD